MIFPEGELRTEGRVGPSRGLRRAGAEWIARAQAHGRPIEPDLLGARRRPVLAQAFARARRRGAGDQLIRALAQELQSANEAS
jgi:hypothetical protein